MHDQGTSAERRYKRSHRRSPGSTNHQRRRPRRYLSPGSGDEKMHHRHHRHKERSHSKVSYLQKYFLSTIKVFICLVLRNQ